MVDQQYCSADHRREARLASAQALRDEEEVEVWSVAKRGKRKNTWGDTGPVRPARVGSILPHIGPRAIWEAR